MKGTVVENMGHALILVTDKQSIEILIEFFKEFAKIHRKTLALSIISIFSHAFLVNILKIVIVLHNTFHMTPYLIKFDEKYASESLTK